MAVHMRIQLFTQKTRNVCPEQTKSLSYIIMYHKWTHNGCPDLSRRQHRGGGPSLAAQTWTGNGCPDIDTKCLPRERHIMALQVRIQMDAKMNTQNIADALIRGHTKSV